MTLEEYLETKPTREEVINLLCDAANKNYLKKDYSFLWDKLSEYAGVTEDDFYDDRQENIKGLSETIIRHYGFYNFKLKECK